MKRGYMYILECADGSYYTGSTVSLKLRLQQHQNGEGANHTKKRLPVKLVYFEEFTRVQDAFKREKQVQKWRREKKEALIFGHFDKLPQLAKNYTEYPRTVSSTSSDTTASSDTALLAEHVEAKHHNKIDTENTDTATNSHNTVG